MDLVNSAKKKKKKHHWEAQNLEETNTNNVVLLYILENLSGIGLFSFHAGPTEAKNKLGYNIRTLFKNCNCAAGQELSNNHLFPFSLQNFNKTHDFFKLLGE